MTTIEIEFKEAVLGMEGEFASESGRKVWLRIPAGAESGLRLRAEGEEFEIRVQESPWFRRVGSDLELDFPVSLAEAVLGGEGRVPTVEGAIQLRIPAGVSSGTRLRIRGKGVADASGARGDQILVVKVVMPEKIDPELEEDIRAWNTRYAYDPRAHFRGPSETKGNS